MLPQILDEDQLLQFLETNNLTFDLLAWNKLYGSLHYHMLFETIPIDGLILVVNISDHLKTQTIILHIFNCVPHDILEILL